MNLLHAFSRLPRAEKGLLITAVLLVGVIRLGLWLMSFQRLHRLINSFWEILPSETVPSSPDGISRAITRASRLVPEATCLTQALALQVMLRRNLTIWRLPDGAFHFSYADQTQFLIESDASEIWCNWSESATVADAAIRLVGPVLGFLLRLRGLVCLHASAVAIGGEAIAIVGQAGSGKSTTAAAFSKLGFRILADDVAALRPEEGEILVLPGYPRLSLWPDAAEALYGSSASLPRLAPLGGIDDSWDKRFLSLETGREFHQTPLPLGAIYVLGNRASDGVVPGIETLSARNAFISLTNETYLNYALDESMRATEFRILGQLVRTTPIRLVTPHNDHARLPELCNAILEDYRQLRLPVAAYV